MMSPIEQVQEKILTLQQQLLTSHPQLPTLLRDIHKQLKEDGEIVTLLTPEEIGILVSGLKVQTQTVIATKTAGSKKKTAITLADL